MRLLIQRVSEASVSIGGEVHDQIDRGLLIFVGVTDSDSEADVERLAHKAGGLRIFSDDDGKMNLSLSQVNGEILVISQFTLYGNAKKGFRPSFTEAAAPDKAERLYELFIQKLKDQGHHVAAGIFAADMAVQLTNDGPVTLLLESVNGQFV